MTSGEDSVNFMCSKYEGWMQMRQVWQGPEGDNEGGEGGKLGQMWQGQGQSTWMWLCVGCKAPIDLTVMTEVFFSC